jgi:predicted amidohydrolase YtcJ
MSRPRIELVVIGQVLVAARGGRIREAEAIGIGGGRVLLAGTEADVRAAAPGARVIHEPDSAVVPGLHDFHLHLVGMARARREVQLDGLDGPAIVAALTDAADRMPPGAWIRGRGWAESGMSPGTVSELNARPEQVPVLVYSHDGHSAWASPAAMLRAGLDSGSADPAGGRIERDADGAPTGVLRESATDLVERAAETLSGPALDEALDEVAAALAALGVTGCTDAGDTSRDGGHGEFAALGDRASLLMAARERLDGRLRVWVGFPADAIPVAAELGLATGALLDGTETIRVGWAKAYADGALGSRTAATFEPYTCEPGGTGILRLEPEQLDELLASSRAARIGLAVHAIGDRAASAVLDALERALPAAGQPPRPRVEHLQLMRPDDRSRLARLGVTASLQPVHCAADRAHVEACWADRAELAYPFASLRDAGARLAFGSDAPIETPNPWHGVFAAVHRRFPRDGTDDWQPAEALTAADALAAYTTDRAEAAGRDDEGHLEPGAVADLAILNVDLPTLLAADERLADVRSLLTLVAGREVHRA